MTHALTGQRVLMGSFPRVLEQQIVNQIGHGC